MTYATQSDLIDRVGERMLIDLTDREDEASQVIDAEAVRLALEQADAEIDGYIINRYKLPMAQVPPTIVDLASTLAIWRLHSFDPSDKLKADYKAAQTKLREIASGVYSLPIEGVDAPTTGGSGARVTDRPRPFSDATMKGWI